MKFNFSKVVKRSIQSQTLLLVEQRITSRLGNRLMILVHLPQIPNRYDENRVVCEEDEALRWQNRQHPA